MIPIDKDKVGSFTIDHTRLEPGIYEARTGRHYKTFDVRMTAPNKEPAMSSGGYHSLEHLMATFVRNHPRIKDAVIALDAMACLTGFYLIIDTELVDVNVYDIRDILIECMEWISIQTEVPATTPATCGNYNLHSLEDAKYYAARYKDCLSYRFRYEYTKLEVILKDGKKFADS